jgi:acetyl-CoA acetyltransferase
MRDDRHNEVEILTPVVREAIKRSGIAREQIGFTCSGSCDYLQGQPFAFVIALDAIGAWPPIEESHVEMDAAWALYEAWVRLQHGDIDSALVYGFGKPSLGHLPSVLTQQLDPYYLQPLWPDALSLAALQARAVAEASGGGATAVATSLPSPLREGDIAPTTDGAAAMVLAAGDLARKVCARPAWIRGIDHRIEPHHPGMRDLAQSRSTALAAEKAGVHARGPIDAAELHVQYAHEREILVRALQLESGTDVRPATGAIAANPVMAAGLARIGEAAQRIIDGGAKRAVAHATSGPCLQQNLVCLLEAE